MDANECLKQVHAALVAKAKAKCAVEGNNKLALEISGKVAEYGSAWATAFGNDGKRVKRLVACVAALTVIIVSMLLFGPKDTAAAINFVRGN